MSNNHWPPQAQPTRFQLFKERERERENPMQRQKRIEEMSNGNTTQKQPENSGKPIGGN